MIAVGKFRVPGGGRGDIPCMAAKALVPVNKHEEELVKLGRKQERLREKKDEAEEKLASVKSERTALRREKDELEQELEAGPRPSYKLIGAVGGLIGTAAGIGLQHFALDKTSLPAPVKKGMAPVLGLVVGAIGTAVDGVPGTLLSNFGFAEASASAGVSIVKKVAGIG